MKLLVPALLLLAALVLGVVAATPEAVLEIFGPLMGMDAKAQAAASSSVASAFAVAAAGCAAFGVLRAYRAITDKSEFYAPIVQALTSVAGEYGRDVETHPERGVGFASRAEGIRLEVLIQPNPPTPGVLIWVDSPARQPLIIEPDGKDSSVDEAEWRLVGRRDSWVLRAEMPSVARPLLDDGALTDAVTAVMDRPYALHIRHDSKGLTIEMGMPPADQLTAAVRAGLAAARRMRLANA